MQITEELKNEIIDNRMDSDNEIKYTDELMKNWIERRFIKLREIEGVKVWMENEVFFIENPEDRIFGFKRYNPNSIMSKRYVEEITFLIRVLLCY